MTVSSTTSSNRYIATAGQTLFPYTFLILDETELSVTSNGSALTLNSDYTVDVVGQQAGGNITLTWEDGAVGGEAITILRSVPYTQTVDYVENEAFPAQTHEDALDRLTMQIQQQLEEIDRAIKFDIDSTQTDITIEDPVASEYLRWKSDLSGIESTSVLTGVTATGVDVTDTDLTKDKMVSNGLAKDWEDLTLCIVPNDVASAVNELQVSTAVTTAHPNILATGSDANINIELEAKGTGVVYVKDSGLTLNSGNVTLTSGDITIDGSNKITTPTNEALNLTPNGTGDLVLDGQKWPQADGSANQTLRTDGAGQTSWGENITLGTEVATTSGTAVDFTGIPAGVKRITIMLNEVSLDGTDQIYVQLGDAGGIETTGYVASASQLRDTTPLTISSTTAFPINFGNATYIVSAVMHFYRMNASHLWVSGHYGKKATDRTVVGGGTKTLSGELTQVRVTRSGTDNFDAGSVNIMYEL